MPRIFATLILLSAALAASGAEVSFSNAVRPLLEQQCMGCHSAGQKLGELDLSTRQSALKGGLHGPAIVPGKPAESRLMHHVTGKAAPQMPLGAALPKESIALLRKWIAAGAPYDAVVSQKEPADDDGGEWWAFQKPVVVQPPSAANEAWRQNPIDGYVFAALAEKGLKPAPRADKRTLIRRAYLDLVGLLPPVAEVERFVADDSPDAWTKLVRQAARLAALR